MIKDFTDRFNVIAGLSDHTLGSLVPIMSLGFGCKVIEKHFIIGKKIGGLLHPFPWKLKTLEL